MRLLLLFAFLAFLPPSAAEEFHEPFEADVTELSGGPVPGPRLE